MGLRQTPKGISSNCYTLKKSKPEGLKVTCERGWGQKWSSFYTMQTLKAKALRNPPPLTGWIHYGLSYRCQQGEATSSTIIILNNGPFRFKDQLKLKSWTCCQYPEDTFFKQWYAKTPAAVEKAKSLSNTVLRFIPTPHCFSNQQSPHKQQITFALKTGNIPVRS